jgi:hypothetical protein
MGRPLRRGRHASHALTAWPSQLILGGCSGLTRHSSPKCQIGCVRRESFRELSKRWLTNGGRRVCIGHSIVLMAALLAPCDPANALDHASHALGACRRTMRKRTAVGDRVGDRLYDNAVRSSRRRPHPSPPCARSAKRHIKLHALARKTARADSPRFYSQATHTAADQQTSGRLQDRMQCRFG